MMAVNGLTRGAGFIMGFTLSVIMDATIRVLSANILNERIGITGCWYAHAIGWFGGAVIGVIALRSGKWKKQLVKVN
jgi:Na+-driven multidrug efflux pump